MEDKRPQPLSKICDTALKYLGNRRVPLMAGDTTVIFDALRKIHMVPNWLAKRMAENDPEEWVITTEKPPVYGPVEQAMRFDPDTPNGLANLRKAFFDNPEQTFRQLRDILRDKEKGLRKVIEEQQERIDMLERIISSNPELSASLRQAKASERAMAPNYLKIIDKLMDEESLEKAIDYYAEINGKPLNAQQAAKLRRDLISYLGSPNDVLKEEYAKYVMKCRIVPAPEGEGPEIIGNPDDQEDGIQDA